MQYSIVPDYWTNKDLSNLSLIQVCSDSSGITNFG